MTINLSWRTIIALALLVLIERADYWTYLVVELL